MPSEYKAAVVTSGEVRALISGDVVDALISGEVILASGQPVLISGEIVETSGQVALISGQPVLMSGQNVIISGQFVLISGQPVLISGEAVRLFGVDSEATWAALNLADEASKAEDSILGVGLYAQKVGTGTLSRLETVASGEAQLAIGYGSGTRTISVSGQLIDSGGQTYTGVAVTFALGKYSQFAVFNTVERSGASGQTVEVQVQFSEDAGATWYDLVDGPFGSLLYEGEQVGAVGVLRDVQTGKVAGGDLRIFIRTSGQTLDSNDNFTISSFTMLLN